MTDSDHESRSMTESTLRDDLPPVQPPTAGFIIQLFVFPALIVMAVVGVWWMFGLIALGEQDYRKLLQDLQSQNIHLRNRAMYGLAQVLEQDARRGDQGQHLRSNAEIAQGLADQLVLELKKNSSSKEGVAIQEFLTRALGIMDSIELISPALQLAMEPQRDLEIRKSALVSLSLVAGRAMEKNEKIDAPLTVDALIQMSTDPTPVLRQSSAFALGLFASPEAIHQLEVLLGDGDQMTRVNAAIGLARHGSTAGYEVIRASLKLPETPTATAVTPTPAEIDARLNQVGEQFLVVKNILKAINDLAPKFDENQKQTLLPLVEELSNKHPEMRIRVDAAAAGYSLKK